MHFVGNLHNAVQMHLYASRCLMLALQLFLSSSAIFYFYSLWFHETSQRRLGLFSGNGFCCRTCRHCSLQSTILCSAFNDTVLDDHARDSFYYCLWIYWLDDPQRLLEFPICFSRSVSFCFVFVTHTQTIHLMWRTKRKHNWGGEGVQSAGVFLSDGVMRERDGGRQRCLLLGIFLDARSRRPAMTALQTWKRQLEQRFILEHHEHVKGMCVIWRTAWKASTSTCTSCTRTKCLCATAMSSASRCTVRRNGHHGTVVLLQCFLLLPYHRVLQAGVAGAFSALHHMCKAW